MPIAIRPNAAVRALLVAAALLVACSPTRQAPAPAAAPTAEPASRVPLDAQFSTPEAELPAAPALRPVDVPAASPVTAATPIAPPSPAAATPPTPAPLPAPREYVVEPGDSVRTIAREFGISNETIIWANDLTDPDHLKVGQVLVILPFTGLIHEVRPGDTVASVANAYEADVHQVIRANRLAEPHIIVVGQSLLVPGGYRPLPRRVEPITPTAPPADRVERPAQPDTQQAAAIKSPRRMPALGSTPQERFIASIAEAAVESHERTGVPASVTIAQAILESYWGSSRLAREANNYFGIKAQTKAGPAGVVWFDVWEVIGGRNVMQREPFRAYNSAAESFQDHGRFLLENPRYAPAMAARRDARQFARELNRAGYATDPAYASKLIQLMERYDLFRFDDV